MNVRVPLMVLLACAWASAQLPITRVILYKSGVGYFERSGTVTAGSQPKLTFRASEMNDVLQSLTVTDSSGGQISDIRFQADQPLSRELALFPFHLQENAPLADFLAQVRGARVAVQQQDAALTGTIVGARSATVPTAAGNSTRQELTLLLDSGEIRTLDLDQVQGVKLLDPALQTQFRKYLSRLAASRDDNQRSLLLELTGKTPQNIEVHYTQAAPVWKTTWRLIFRPQQPPLLEGWAIVNNTGSDDWRNVRLELVSGRPVSFISPLFAPDFLRRPRIQLAEDQALRPVEGGQSEEVEVTSTIENEQRGAAGGVLGGVLGGIPAAAPPPNSLYSPRRLPSVMAKELAASSVHPHIVTHPHGSLFSYALAHPVTIDRGQAAMVPILQQPVQARQVLIYSEQTGEHPRAGVRLTNNTGDTLDGGPMLVYDRETYAGEGLVATMPATDERLIDYASAPEVTIREQRHFDDTPIRELHAKDGFLFYESDQMRRTSYHIEDIGAQAGMLVLKHPADNEFHLVSPARAKRTESSDEFDLHLQPHSTRNFVVVERHPVVGQITLSVVDAKTIVRFLANKTLSADDRQQLGQFLALLRSRDTAAQQAEDTRKAIGELTQTQDRLRKNIDSLNRVPGEDAQVKTYATELARQEGQFDQLQQKLESLGTQANSFSAKIAAAAQKLSF